MDKKDKVYACVYYIDEESYSTVKAERIAYNTVNYSSVHETVGLELPVVWEDTGDECEATIIAIGTKSKMAQLAASLAKEARDKSFDQAEASGRKRKRRSSPTNDNIENNGTEQKKKTSRKSKPVHEGAMNVIQTLLNRNAEKTVPENEESAGMSTNPQGVILNPDFDDSANDLTSVIVDKNKEIEELRRQLLREKNKVYNLQRRTTDDSEVQDFGYGLRISKNLVSSIRDRYRGSPSQFLRALMEQTGAFTLEEISQHSVYGRKSSSNSNLVRPALPQKFTTLKDFVIAECDLSRGSASFMKFEASVRGICSDARKRLKILKSSSGNSV